ncbi:unnamed protein product [Acanthoscelides obtectus]|nr:unnamed protein product [Acanthoscelides obtectus]CAH2018780.1 unnamed protein product [Acanthoscelides obtectus]CAK1627251.1 hypothetical protein AOBTE_LOCUS4433 [Acanthoscelides obtectus]CAK1688708.1 hypothetical protein AOBTE_LOCUS36820 [Acanthoscelides obtectus]
MVARGMDISNLQSFLFHLKANCKGLILSEVQIDDAELDKIEKTIPKILPPYTGILQCHEVVWVKPHTFLDIRKLTCLSCSPSKAQLICDQDLKIISMFAGYPDSVYDAKCFTPLNGQFSLIFGANLDLAECDPSQFIHVMGSSQGLPTCIALPHTHNCSLEHAAAACPKR